MRMGALVAAGLLASGAWSSAAAADPKDPLERARVLYNQRDFVGAVTAAEEGRRSPLRADSADLIAARAYLERYRESAASDDLANARDRLRRINPERFDDTERVEFVVGLGEALFFDGAPGAAAAVFASVLAGPDYLEPSAREHLLDWWASAVDADARRQPDIERQAMYQRIRDRMVFELGANPASLAGSYWLAAAARGQGDLDGAWDAAQAGWVRAPLAVDRGAALRGDLDRLVLRGIIPERARLTSQSTEILQSEWELFKERWNR
jgi:hypothetical protein